MPNEVKLSVRLGQLEIDYEGPLSFVEGKLSDFCREISELKVAPVSVSVPQQAQSNSSDIASPAAGATPALAGMSMNALAAKFGISKGVDLFRAASIHLTLVQGKEIFPKAQILEEAKKANSYYKESTHRKNTGQLISTLLREDFLREQGGENVAMSADAISSAKAKLGVG